MVNNCFSIKSSKLEFYMGKKILAVFGKKKTGVPTHIPVLTKIMLIIIKIMAD